MHGKSVTGDRGRDMEGDYPPLLLGPVAQLNRATNF